MQVLITNVIAHDCFPRILSQANTIVVVLQPVVNSFGFEEGLEGSYFADPCLRNANSYSHGFIIVIRELILAVRFYRCVAVSRELEDDPNSVTLLLQATHLEIIHRLQLVLHKQPVLLPSFYFEFDVVIPESMIDGVERVATLKKAQYLAIAMLDL